MLTLAMAKYGFKAEESVMIGDRVYTDIASGYNAGIDTIFVLPPANTVLHAAHKKPARDFRGQASCIAPIFPLGEALVALFGANFINAFASLT